MASSSSAVLDVVAEHRDLSSILRHSDSLSAENSLVKSASVESFSTIQDVENLFELNVDQNSDLCVKIDNPQKHLETLETFITFRITTKVARIEFSENEYVVRRRYNDFIWLRQKLNESHPFCIIPPLPGKHSIIEQLDRYSKEFILSRMKALNVFISRIAQHPILSCNEHLKMFLTTKQPDFNLHRRQRNHFENRIRSNPPNSSHTALRSRHQEFDKMKSYLGTLCEKLMLIEKISSRMNKHQSELVAEFTQLHPVFTSWADSEPELAPFLRGIGKAVERNAAVQSKLVQTHNSSISNPIKDFLAYVDVVQDTLKKREAYQCAYENSLEELNKRHNEKDKLLALATNSSPNSSFSSFWKQPSCDEKLEKLGICIPQLLKKVEANQDSLECANESLRSDLSRWQIEKMDSLKKILMEFVGKQIECCQVGATNWQGVIRGNVRHLDD